MIAQRRLSGVHRGQRIGLFGGSFDPPHVGHVHVSEQALKRFGLDQVVWLVSPGNPLKPNAPAPLAERCAAAKRLLTHPKIRVSAVESVLGTRYTAQTLQALQALHPDVRFVWLMGADNLAQFHRWDRWREIMHQMPIGVLARPGQRTAARGSVASRVFRSARISARQSQRLAMARAPAWCFVNMPLRFESSTALRAQAGCGAAKS